MGILEAIVAFVKLALAAIGLWNENKPKPIDKENDAIQKAQEDKQHYEDTDRPK